MKKKVLASIIAMTMAAACLTACGDSSKTEENTSSSKAESSSSAETTTTTTTAATTTPEATAEEPKVPTETIDALAKAYASTPHAQNCNAEGNSLMSYGAVISDNERYVYFIATQGNRGRFYRYDRETKKSEWFIKGAVSDFAYCNGYIYITGVQNQKFYIAKYDEKGKLIKEINDDNPDYWYTNSKPLPSAPVYVLDNGMVVVETCYLKPDKKEERTVLFSADLKNKTEIWHETKSNEHNVLTKNKPEYMTNTGVYCYYSDDDIISVYDTNTSKWTDYECKKHRCDTVKAYENYLISWSNDYATNTVECNVFEKDTGKKIDMYVHQNYMGGTEVYQFMKPSEESELGWYKTQAIATAPDKFDYKYVSPQKDEGNIYVINNKYYLYRDSYGVFLRTYEKGEKEEEVLFVSDQEKW